MAETDSESDEDVLDVDLEEPEDENDEETVETEKESSDSPESDVQEEAEDTGNLKDSIFRLTVAVGPIAFLAGILALVINKTTIGAALVFIGLAAFVVGVLSFSMAKFEEAMP